MEEVGNELEFVKSRVLSMMDRRVARLGRLVDIGGIFFVNDIEIIELHIVLMLTTLSFLIPCTLMASRCRVTVQLPVRPRASHLGRMRVRVVRCGR